MESLNIKSLLIRPNPQKNESWRGYVLRVSEENVLSSPRIMLRHSQVSEKNLRTAFPHISNICALTLKSESTLKPIYPLNHKKNSYRVLEQTIPKSYIRVNKPMLCAECVKELGYILARWDVIYMQVCHKHKKKLIDQCPSCNSKLKWYRQGLLKCHCAYDFSNVVGPSASDEEVYFSELLSHVIESEPTLITNEKNIIPASFFNMSLKALLGVFNTLGLAKLDLDGKTKLNMPFGSADVYSEGVQILNNWPSSFQKIIHINELKYGKNLRSIRQRHENLYGSIFKKGYPENEISFVRDDFVKFAQSTDVPGYVDKRIKNKVNINTTLKFTMGINEAAKALGIMASTLRKRILKDKIQTQVFKTKQGKQRHLVNLDQIETKIPNQIGELGVRKAAAYIDLPVRVMKLLRETNHYYDKHKTIYPKGWAILDLNEFIARVLAPISDSYECSDLLPISKFMLMKFRSTDIKAEIIRGVLDGRIKSAGPARKIGQILVSKEAVINLTNSKRLNAAAYLKLSDVSKLIGIDKSCRDFILKHQVFRTMDINNITYFNREDVEHFNKEFIAISRIATENELSARRLVKQSEKNDIFLYQIERSSGVLQSFIKKSDQEKLKSLYFD